MKPKRTLDEAYELFTKGNTDPKQQDFFDALVGSAEDQSRRTNSLDLFKRYGGIIGVDEDSVMGQVVWPSIVCTLIDIGIVIGRLMHEDPEYTPSSLGSTDGTVN